MTMNAPELARALRYAAQQANRGAPVLVQVLDDHARERDELIVLNVAPRPDGTVVIRAQQP